MIENELKDMISLSLYSAIGFDASFTLVEKSIDVSRFEIGDEKYLIVSQEQLFTILEFLSINSALVAKNQIYQR